MEQTQLHNYFNDDGSCNTTLIFNSARALARFKVLLTNSMPRNDEATEPGAPLDTVPLNFLYMIVLILQKQINEECLEFIEKVFDRATDIVFHRPQAQIRVCTNDASGCTQP